MSILCHYSRVPTSSFQLRLGLLLLLLLVVSGRTLFAHKAWPGSLIRDTGAAGAP